MRSRRLRGIPSGRRNQVALIENGARLMVYPMGGTIDGVYGDHVLLAPPFIVTAGEISEIVTRLGDAVDAAVASAR